ncbi:MAG: zinc finger CCHC domain-containing protein, partial [Gloeomargaritales cyanobacterium]
MNEQFQLLEDSGDLMSDRQQIEHICRNIKDKRYIMECSIIKSDLKITLDEAQKKLHRLELETRSPDLSVDMKANNARGRGGGKSGRKGGRGRGHGERDHSRFKGRGRGRSRGGFSQTTFVPTCYKCGKQGHMSYDCDATTTAIAAQTSIDQSTENDEDENDSSRKRSRVNFTGVGKIVQ